MFSTRKYFAPPLKFINGRLGFGDEERDRELYAAMHRFAILLGAENPNCQLQK